MVKDEKFVLSNGVEIPSIGFGTWQIPNGEIAYKTTLFALKEGYRHIDTAYAYGNEESIGKAIKDSTLKREDIFITSKLPSHIKTYDGALEYFDKTLKALDVTYLDLYLIHAPWPWQEIGKDCTKGNIEAWKAMIKLYNDKKIRAIGVSNFLESDIKPLIEATGFKPMINQIRYFVGNTLRKLTKYCQDNDILVEAYSPLATGELVNKEVFNEMAEKYHVSVAQLCIRYCYQNHTLALPKAVTPQHIKDNLNIDFIISDEDMNYLDSLENVGSRRPFRS